MTRDAGGPALSEVASLIAVLRRKKAEKHRSTWNQLVMPGLI